MKNTYNRVLCACWGIPNFASVFNPKIHTRMKTKFYFLAAGILSLAFLTSCNQDNKQKEDPSARTLTDLNVSAYDKWVYLSFETGTPVELGVDEKEPEVWDIALHRENVKTNKGAALQSDATSLNALATLPSGTFTPDVTDSIIVDMSQMMQGIIGYQESELNMVLNAWVSHSGMPPVYTVNENVYVVRTKEGKYAKIQFSSYKNAEDKTGYATFSYVYPAFE